MKFAKRVWLPTSTILSISSSLVNSQWKGNTRITNNSQWPNSSIKTIYSKHQPKQKSYPLIITNQNKTTISNSKRKHSQFVYPHNPATKYELAIKWERESWQTGSERERGGVKENEREPLGVILVFYKGLDSDRWVPLLSNLLRECHWLHICWKWKCQKVVFIFCNHTHIFGS